MRKPALYIMCGLPFSGKTTLAKELENQFWFDRVDIDEIKRDYGLADKSDDIVSDEEWGKIYQDMYKKIEVLMQSKGGIISDVSNLRKGDRDKLRELSKKFDYSTWVIYLKTPVEVVKERWLRNRVSRKRFDLTNEVFYEAIKSLEEPSEDENIIVLDYKQSVDDWVKTLSSH